MLGCLSSIVARGISQVSLLALTLVGSRPLDPGALAIMVLLMLLVMFLIVNLALASSLANLEKFSFVLCRETVSTLSLDTRLFKQTETVDLLCVNSKFVISKSRLYL
mgnify:CR=1 FL=1